MNDRIVPPNSDFDSLLSWLSENREVAGEAYEKIRLGLIRYFYFKGCKDSESLADEAISRVTKKLPTLDLSAGNKPITIFYGFAANVALEELRKDKLEVPLEGDFSEVKSESNEQTFACMDICLANLPIADETLLRDYYAKDKSEKFSHRKKLAEASGLTPGALHVKLHRLRNEMRKCIENCLKKKDL